MGKSCRLLSGGGEHRSRLSRFFHRRRRRAKNKKDHISQMLIRLISLWRTSRSLLSTYSRRTAHVMSPVSRRKATQIFSIYYLQSSVVPASCRTIDDEPCVVCLSIKCLGKCARRQQVFQESRVDYALEIHACWKSNQKSLFLL